MNTTKLDSVYRRICAIALTLTCLCLVLNSSAAVAQTGSGFDHAATAFPLLGSHEQVRCEACHIKGIFKTTPRDCYGCHVANNQRGAVAMPTTHVQTDNRCDACHNVSSFAAVVFNHSNVMPGTCGACHDGSRAKGQSSNHIITNLSCDVCHTSVSFLPVKQFPHSALGGDTTTCATCHDGRGATGMPVNHIPRANPAMCGSCHVVSTLNNFTSFSGGMMDHSGMTGGCADCHGPSITGATFAGISSIVVMPPTSPAGPNSHIPSSITCESCHLGSLPIGLVDGNASRTPPGSGFASPAPTGAQIHAGVTGGCNSCHDTNFVWMGMSAYPISPTILTASAQYKGFQTRPKTAAGTYSVADAAHPGTGDCSQCHTGTNYFSSEASKPANHIPMADSAQCSSCHTTPGDFATMPTLANIHSNAPSTTSNCAQCHAANVVAGFAIPAANFTIVGPPGNHIPTGAACETCHVGAGSSIAATPVGNGAKFSGSLMSHTGITSNCEACHGPGITGSSFAGVSQIVVMPPTSPVGASAHIPSSTSCETCHLGTTPTGLVPASATKTAPGTAFATPAPTTTQIHTGVTSGCSACHDTNYVWMGVSAYPISPTVLTAGAQYTGFQTRPKTAAGTYNIADPAHPSTGDCSQCHSNTNSFTALDKPANHIPTSATAQCTACHTTSNFSVMPTLANIHANAPSTSNNCALCHAANVVAGFAIPAANFAIVGPPGNHIPTNAACETCHVGAGSSIAATPVGNGAKFSGSLMSHTGITSNCADCHGPGITGSSFAGISQIVVMPPTSPAGTSAHIPSSTTCETCHLGTTPAGLVPASATKTAPGTAFATPAPTTTQIHSGITSGCIACHDTNYVWMGMNAYPISPTVLTAGAQYTGFQTRPKAAAGTYNIADPAHPSTGDCSQCHSNTNYFTALDKPTNHIPTSATAQCTACHTSSDFSVMPTMANIHANAPSTTSNCAQCHAANVVAGFAIPAANFAIVGPPGNHIPTSAACETCHVGAGSSIAATPVGDGAKFSGSLMSHTGIASNCAACHGPGITGSSFAGISQIVVMPPTSPVGASAHIPSSTTCETCHLGTTPAGLIPASATKAAPGTAFATPAPTGVQIHTGITGGCVACHDTNYVWMGMSAYPISPTTLTSGAQYTGFQTRPTAAAGTFNVADPAHPGTGDCSQCHVGTNYFTSIVTPTNHIPISTTAQCTACHTTPGDFATIPTLANIHANAPSTTNNCALCHAANVVAGFAIPAANFTIVGPPSNHVPITTACEACHVGAGSSIAATPVGNGAKFSGSLMSHAGITSNCATCHGPGITGSSFAGISQIVVMPPTSPVGASAHIPSSTTCETCHLGTTPAGLVPASATKTAPGTAFATPAPTTTQIHSGITSGCNACHDTNYVWMGVSAYPISPTVLTAGAQYTGFQTRPKAAAGTYNIADAAHPGTGDCSQCHGNTNYFTAVDKPANHIPMSTTAQCTACHTSSDFSVMPTLASIHANAPSTTSNCAQCHAANVVAGFAIPAANFTIVGPPGNHMPITTACEVCHVGAGSSIAATPVGNGAKFSGSRMSHAGITSNCAACHGPGITGSSFAGVSQIVVMPPTSPVGASAHIPSSTTCETCHLGTTPAGLVPASATKSAPGTAFATPAPTTAQIHSGVTSGCIACHDTNYVWMGVSAYPISPSVLTAGAQYTGFQTRPKAAAGTYNIADPTHPGTGDCSQCHGNTNYFSALDKPANHIPTSATAQCTACHTTPGDFATMPTLANIHANAPSTTSNCAQCHAANVVAGFAIPAANFTIVGPPGNHMPITTACEVCHVGAGSSIAATPVGNGAKFSGSRMSHAGITSNCAACHGPGITGSSFAGISQIVVMPPTSPVGASAHIPSSTTCETCHLGTTPAGLVPASATKTAPGTAFATPAPTTAQIHSGITSGCNACHDTNYVWMGMNAYPIAPTTLTSGAQYTGFQTRPKTAAGTYSVADAAHPGTGDCSQCHTGTNFFVGDIKPANHIPTSTTAQCTACHTSSDFSVMPTLASIHANAPSTTSNCAQCHAANVVAGFAIPAANFTIVGPPGNHMPITTACEVCHVGAGSSIAATPVGNGAKFSGSRMSHAGITSNCAACHGPGITGSSFAGVSQIVVMPPTSPVGASAHIPSSTTCETCHLGTTPAGLVPASATKSAPGTAFATPAPTTAQIHSGVTSGCIACHDTNYVWMGVSAYPISPSVLTAGAQYTGFQTRPKAAAGTYNIADPTHPGTGDCSQCHGNTNYFSALDKPANHIPTSATAQCTACHTTPGDFATMPTLANIHANAPSTTSNCAQCHAANVVAGFAIPAANFTIVGPPGNHMPITTACEVCHVGAGSSIAATPVGNGAKFSGSRMSHAGITSNCAACHGPGITGSSFAGVSQIVVMPPTSPVGASAHIPSSTTCETCHLGTTPAGLVPASATKSAPGTAFATPAPTTAQIHSGVTSGCNACHDTNYVWMGMSAYPIAPTTLTSGAQYTGFQTRPKAAASTFSVADAAHPSSGDCSQCHTGTNFFVGDVKPANHIPTSTTAQCTACHTSSDFSVMPTLASIHANAPSTTSNCAQCHAANVVAGFAIPAANFTIVGPPGNHMPITTACEVCHVGAGSSIAATPVGNGAKFSGSRMSHAGITSNCAACHGPGITGSSFAGVSQIVVMPPTSPVGASAHIPSSTTCETCHLGTTPAGLVPASATKSAPGTAFATPAPTTAQIHSGVTSGCNACHDTNYVWMGMSAYPIAPTTLTSGAQYTGFHSRPKAAASTFSVADAAHPSTGDCSQCHSGTNYFSAQDKPANHIPTSATAQCAACHTTPGDFATMPTLANIHANAPSTTSNCAQCHAANVVAGFAIPAANFTIVGPPGNHMPITTACEVCHVGAGSSIAATPVGNGAKFSGSRMSHAGITSNCAACHGPGITGSSFAGVSQIVVMPPTSPVGASAHIPSSTTCETCHLGTTPAGLVPASATKTAPGTAFATPAPTTAQIHSGITSGCNACHDTNYVWMGMNAYPIAPTTLTSGAQYTGFQTRPKAAASTFSVADAAHPSSGDCSQCHTGTNFFVGDIKPANHIPTSTTAQCTACHTSSDFSVMPTLASIHANAPSTTSNCAQCHAANVVAGFAIPAANFTIVGPPGNHMPITTACEVCHVGAGSSIAATPVGNGAKFSGSRMSHAGITSNCAACHGPGITGSSFAGVSQIVVMPPTSPVGASAHIPSSTTCETCHLGTTPAGLVPASATKSAPGTAFATPAPTTAQIHSGVTSGCNACHDTNYVWMGMSAYPIAPTTLTSGAQYTGFHSRPKAAASTFSVADAAHPSTGDCSQCHTGTNYFTGIAKPAGHIPTTAACATCHIVSGDYSVAGLASNAVLHTGISSGCITCHSAGSGAGPFAGCTTQATCASPPPLTYQPKVTPLAAGTSPTAPSSSTHVPSVGISCEKCHSPTVFTSFIGMNMKGNTPAHVAVGAAPCIACHEGGYKWYGVTIVTKAVGHEGRKAGQDCIACHTKVYTKFSGAAARVRPVMRGALNTINQRILPGGGLGASALPGNLSAFSHAGVSPGQCQTCHNGQAAKGMPAKHVQTRLSCDTCHRTTAWKPAQFSHQGVLPGQCQVCHNNAAATGKAARHFMTARSCDSCHLTVAWVPVSYSHLSPLYQPQADKTTCVSCHVTNGEIILRQMRGNIRPKPPVRP